MVKNKILKVFGLLTILIVLTGWFAPQVNAAYYKRLVFGRFAVNAGETLSIGDVVCLKDADGEAYKADADDSALRPAVGICGTAGTDGNPVEIITHGVLSGWTSLTEGAVGYLHTTAGAITQTAPTYAQKVAVAISTTEYLIICEQTTNNIVTLGTIIADVTLDDGSGASPSFVMTDETNESATFSKVDSGYLTVTTAAADGVQVLTGSLKVGNGSPDTTVNGEDAYIEGTLEVDGALNFDGTADFASTVAAAGDVTLDDGSGASPSLTLQDATDETAVFSKVDAGYMTITTVAGDGVQITTGNLRIGDGSEDATIDGEDLYVEGISEFDGAMRVDGALTTNSTITAVGNVTLDDGAGASPSLILTDATDETATFSKADGAYTSITTEAADGFQVLTGSLKIGNGTPGITVDGEDFYCEGDSEFVGTVTLDDGAGASPSVILKDATDETATFSKADGAYTSITTQAADGFQVLTGSLKIGDGSPDATIDGEDFYCEGVSEFDGAMRVDGAIAANSTITGAGNVDLDDGSGASPSFTLTDETNETAVFSKVDAGYMTITTVAGDGVQVTTGNLKVGNGTPVQAIDGEDLYVEGDAEITGTLYASGGLQYEGTDDAAETTIAFTDPSADCTITFPEYTGDVPTVITTDYADHSATNQTTDGTSISVPDAILVAGQSIRWTLAGTCTGTNAAKNVILYIDNAAIITFATATADVGDWVATFIMTCSATNAQRVLGFLQMGDTIVNIADYATDTTDFNDGAATTIKTQVVSGNAGDTICQTMCVVEFLP